MTICEKFPDKSIDTMLEILNSALKQGKEMGATVKEDYTLGSKVKGEAHSISIDRSGSIGAYHVHPYAGEVLSDADIIEMAEFDSQVECIGAESDREKKIACYVPADNIEFNFFLGDKVKKLQKEIRDFSKDMKSKYPNGKPQTEMEWGMARALVRRRNNLGQEIEKRKDKLLTRCNIK